VSCEERLKPSIELGKNGYLLTTKEAETLNEKMEIIKSSNNYQTVFTKETAWKKGDKIIQKDLAETLRRIKENGKAGFYEGKTADLLVAEMQKGKGIITHEDLKNYEAIWRKPVTFEYDNYTISSMPPPSSGGVCLAQILGMIEPFPLDEYGFNSTKSVHLIAEAERRAYADRAKHLGDADFYKVPLLEMINENYLAKRMINFNENQATSSDSIAAGQPLLSESEETTHISIVDSEGNAVSVTTTLNLNYGSKIVVEGAGFFLNNEMDDFSAKPGVPNQFGLVGETANAVEAEKRMLSSMTPTIIEKDDQLFMVVGTPGGSTIITSVLQTFLNVVEFEMSIEAAVNAKRFHHQWLPDQITVEENGFDSKTINELKNLGHKIETRSAIGKVEAILVGENGMYQGAADIRGDDTALGY